MATGLFKSPDTIDFACCAMRSKFVMADKYVSFFPACSGLLQCIIFILFSVCVHFDLAFLY